MNLNSAKLFGGGRQRTGQVRREEYSPYSLAPSIFGGEEWVGMLGDASTDLKCNIQLALRQQNLSNPYDMFRDFNQGRKSAQQAIFTFLCCLTSSNPFFPRQLVFHSWMLFSVNASSYALQMGQSEEILETILPHMHTILFSKIRRLQMAEDKLWVWSLLV